MPAIAPVVLADSVPANHTYDPLDIVSGVSRLGELIAAGYNELTQYILPRSKRLVAKQRLKVGVVRDVNGQMQVVDYMYVNIDMSAPDVSSELERKDLATLAKSLAARADFITAFSKRQNYY